ncbi:hypothetical protein GWK47_021100 [Chionoecetes opilio]|uniref:Uncharacterized protein n=1 Tax=Chionoecetes opilio TaxID=41210 RepID=A0A8J4XPC4_CHIOP|nr:hypothetical protein GWK47_021100 [Chionoecetes opilio]
MPFPAARGSEDDEEEIASPPFETLDTTHLSPPPVDMISSLIRYLEESRLSADNRRIQDDEERCQRDEERRLRDNEARRKEEDSRFQVLVTLLSPGHRPHSASSARDISSPPPLLGVGASGATPKVASPATSTASLAASLAAATPTVATSAGKHVAHSPPTLLADSSFQVFRQWRRLWEDYLLYHDSQRLPRHKQLIQLRMAVSLDVQRILEHTLGIAPDTSLTVTEVLDTLQSHFKSQRNEALRRRELLCCKQADGESFSDFFVRLKNLAEEVDLCTGNAMTCAEIQLKMVLLMGVRDEELIQRLISLDTGASLQDVVTCCRSFEATRHTASAIYSLQATSPHVHLQEGQASRQDPHSLKQPP